MTLEICAEGKDEFVVPLLQISLLSFLNSGDNYFYCYLTQIDAPVEVLAL